MPALALTDLLSNARAQWLGGDPQAWTRYVECCLQFEAELRDVQRTKPAVRPPSPSPLHLSRTTEPTRARQ